MQDIDEKEKLFISSLSEKVSNRELSEHFSQFGVVKRCHISKHPNCNNKGFAHIEMKDYSVIPLILNANHYIQGQKIKVAQFQQDRWTYKTRKVLLKQIPHWLKANQLKKVFEKYGQVEKVSKEHNFILYKWSQDARKVMKMEFVNVGATKLFILKEKMKKKINTKNMTNNWKKMVNVDQGRSKQSNPRLVEDSLDSEENEYVKKKAALRDSYYKGEFLDPERLRLYLKKILEKNLQIKNILKEDIRLLQPFYYNEERRRKLGPSSGIMSYYTVVIRVRKKINGNHKENYVVLRWLPLNRRLGI